MQKYIMLSLFIIANLSFNATFAMANNSQHMPPRPHPISPHYAEFIKDEYHIYDDYKLSESERKERIEWHLNAHKELTMSQKKEINFHRNAIIRLMPNSLEKDIVQSAFKNNDEFENAVDMALEKMNKKNMKYGYDLTTKPIFGVSIDFIR